MFSTRAAARLSGWSPERIRSCARAGLLDPLRDSKGEYQFTFQDIVLLRTVKERVTSDSARSLKEALRELRGKRDGLELAPDVQAAVEAEARALPDEQESAEESGEVCFTFVPPAPGRAFPALPATDSADALYLSALELEQSDPAAALAAYVASIALNPVHANAHNNAGRLLHARGRMLEAIAHYRAALQSRPHGPSAYNLGLAYEQLGRLQDAIESFELALTIDHGSIDAHAALARLYERAGDRLAALRHLKACRELRP